MACRRQCGRRPGEPDCKRPKGCGRRRGMRGQPRSAEASRCACRSRRSRCSESPAPSPSSRFRRWRWLPRPHAPCSRRRRWPPRWRNLRRRSAIGTTAAHGPRRSRTSSSPCRCGRRPSRAPLEGTPASRDPRITAASGLGDDAFYAALAAIHRPLRQEGQDPVPVQGLRREGLSQAGERREERWRSTRWPASSCYCFDGEPERSGGSTLPCVERGKTTAVAPSSSSLKTMTTAVGTISRSCLSRRRRRTGGRRPLHGPPDHRSSRFWGA